MSKKMIMSKKQIFIIEAAIPGLTRIYIAKYLRIPAFAGNSASLEVTMFPNLKLQTFN